MNVSRFLHCPECRRLRQFQGPLYASWELQCDRCSHRWTQPPALSAIETIIAVRALLEKDWDASRRSFYNAASTLYEVAALVDGFPTLIPVDGTELEPRPAALDVPIGEVPGDVRSCCPYCGLLVALNRGEQRIAHVDPVCATFDTEIRKQTSFDAAAQLLKAKTVTA